MKHLSKTTRGGPRPGAGRPRKKPTITLSLRIYSDEKADWIRAAKRSPQGTLTTWARTTLNAAADTSSLDILSSANLAKSKTPPPCKINSKTLETRLNTDFLP